MGSVFTRADDGRNEEWRKKLTSKQFHVTREKGTEKPFSSELLNNKEPGIYKCVCCDAEIFSSENKFDSHCGWPAFDAALDKEKNLSRHNDFTFGMLRTEVKCNKCDAHLGHVFNDGPRHTTGERFCINGVALKFDKKQLGQSNH